MIITSFLTNTLKINGRGQYELPYEYHRIIVDEVQVTMTIIVLTMTIIGINNDYKVLTMASSSTRSR